MLVSTFVAVVEKLRGFLNDGHYLLLCVGGALLLITLGIIIEGARTVLRGEHHDDDMISFPSEG